MAISGKFLADFQAFDAAVKNAVLELKGFEQGGAKVQTQMNRVANSLSGTKLIADANLMTEAVARIGGATKLTEAEQRKVNAALDEALQKYKALGEQAPDAMIKLHRETKQLTTETEGAAVAQTKLGSGLSQVDNILGALGINIGNEARGLKQLGEHAETSGGKLDLLGKTGLVVGAAVGGWKIGRAVAEFLDLDKAIGDATAALLEFADVAAAEGGAKADLLARATKIAGVEIQDLGLAMAITRGEAELQMKAMAAVGNETTQLAAKTAALEAQQKAADEAKKVRNERLLKDTATQLAAVNEAAKVESAAILATTKLWDQYFELRVTHGGTANEQAIAQIDRWAADLTAQMVKAGTATKAFYEGLAAVSREKMAAVGIDWDLWRTKSIPALQEAADNALKTYNAMVASGQFHRSELEKQLAKYKELRDAARGYGDSGVDASNRIIEAQQRELEKANELNKAREDAIKLNRQMGGSFEVTRENFAQTARGLGESPGAIETLLKRGYSFEQALLWARHPNWPPPEHPGPRVPGFASGVENFRGGMAIVGERGPELVQLPRGSNVIPTGRGVGHVSVQMFVNGFLDPRTIQQMTQLMTNEIMQSLDREGTPLN